MLFDQVGDDFGISFRGELVTFLDQLLFEREVILDNAIVDHHDPAGAVAMRMGILFTGTAVRGPASVADPVGAIERLGTDDLFQITQLAFRATNLQAFAVAGDSDSSGIVPPIFQPPEPINDDRNNRLLPYIADNPAHGCELLLAGASRPSANSLVFQGVAVFFNHGIGEDLPRYAFHLRLRLGLAKVVVERELKVLALADITQALVAHLLQRALNGLALRVQNALLERDVDVSFHRCFIIRDGKSPLTSGLECPMPLPERTFAKELCCL